MTQIPNWSRTETRNVSDVTHYALGGTVREWVHDETGDTVSILVNDEDDRFYTVRFNGEDVAGASTLRQAESGAVETLRNSEDGL